MGPYVTITDLARRWRVDRATVRTALDHANILPSTLHASPRFPVGDVMRKIEQCDDVDIESIDLAETLETAEELAARLGVTTQTIRNYGRAGRLHRVQLSPRTIRYALGTSAKMEGEANFGGSGKK